MSGNKQHIADVLQAALAGPELMRIAAGLGSFNKEEQDGPVKAGDEKAPGFQPDRGQMPLAGMAPK